MTDLERVNLSGVMAHHLKVLCTATGVKANQITQQTRTVLNLIRRDGTTYRVLCIISISARGLKVGSLFCVSNSI